MEEVQHHIQVIESAKKAFLASDSGRLKELSNETIHCACTMQETSHIGLAVILYSLAKIVERKGVIRMKNWNVFMKKISSLLTLSAIALRENRIELFEDYLKRIRISMSSVSVNLKPYIEEVIRKASVNKASKVYEHGISMGRTAALLGITQWELSEYAGQADRMTEIQYNKTLDIRARIKMAQEFFG